MVLHLPEQNYSDEKHQTFNNTNPLEYTAAIDFFLASGLKVIRIGHAGMKKLSERPGFIDLTIINCPGEVDIYLSASAQFYFGSASGPYNLANQFGVLCAITSLLPYGEQRRGNFNNFMRLEDMQTNKVLGTKEICDRGFDLIQSSIVFEQASIRPKPQTLKSILDFAQETIEYINGGKIFKENQAKKEMLEGKCNYSSLSSGSLELCDFEN